MIFRPVARWACFSAIALGLLCLTAGLPAFAETAVERAGDVGAIALPITAGLAALGHRDGSGVVECAEAVGSTLAVVYALKFTVNRQRPDGGTQSFPSGHTAAAFAGAGFLQRRYGWAYGAPAYAVAAFVGYSRVRARRHWTSDVLAGAAIGVGANLAFTHARRRLDLVPVFVPGGVGWMVQARW